MPHVTPHPTDKWSLMVGDVVWEPCHSYVDGVTTEVDAYFYKPGFRHSPTRYLDVTSLGDVCCVTSADAELATTCWNGGSVYARLERTESGPLAHVMTLVVPHLSLDKATIVEALARFAP